MRKHLKKIMALFVLLTIAMNGFAQKINWMDYKKVTMQQVLDQAKQENKYVFVDIWTPWCGVCKAIDKYIFTRKDVSEFFNKNTINLTFDAEYGDWQKVARKFGATAFPTILILNQQGEIVWAIDNLGVPTPQQQTSDKSEVGERLMEQAKMGMQLESMTDEQFTDSTTFAFMRKYSVVFNSKAFDRLIANKEVMQQKYGRAFIRLCKESLGSASCNMLTYGKGGTHILNEDKLAQYEDAVKRLNLPETQTLLIDPKISIYAGQGKWKELLDLIENNESAMTPYMYADAIGSFAEDCHDKTLINRAAPIFKKATTIKMNEREKAALTEAYHIFTNNNK